MALAQVIFALPPEGETDLTMRILNSDGSEPEMCGNGIRCLAKFYALLSGDGKQSYRVHTPAGAVPSIGPSSASRVWHMLTCRLPFNPS